MHNTDHHARNSGLSLRRRTLLGAAALLGAATLAPGLARADAAHPKIGFSIDDLRIERWSHDRDYFVAAAKSMGATVDVQSADASESRQNSQIENLISRGMDVIVIVPFNGKALTNVVNEARQAGIKVISYDRLILDAPVDAYVSFDNFRVGQMQAQGPLVDANKIKIVGAQWVPEWSASTALSIMENVLTANKDIAGVVASNDALAGGVIQALSAQGLAGKVAVSGQDADLAALQRINKGTQTMTVYKPLKQIATTAATMAVDLARGKQPDYTSKMNNGSEDVPTVLLTPIALTRANLDRVVQDGYFTQAQIDQ